MEAPHNLQDIKDLLLMAWCQMPQHTFFFYKSVLLSVRQTEKPQTISNHSGISSRRSSRRREVCSPNKTTHRVTPEEQRMG